MSKKPSKIETRLKANRALVAAWLEAQTSPKLSQPQPSPPKPPKKASNINPKPLKNKKKGKQQRGSNEEYRIPGHTLNVTDASEFHLMYVRIPDRQLVSERLPYAMHICSDGKIRYKRGKAPGSIKAANAYISSDTPSPKKRVPPPV